MATSKPSKALLSAETPAICRKCLSTDGALEPVTSDERGEYLLQQMFSCTNVQMKLLPEFSSYLCLACKSRFDFLDKLCSIWILTNAKIERLKKQLDTIHLTGTESTVEQSAGNIQQIDGVGSVVKTEVAVEDSEEDYQLSQTVSNAQQLSSIYDYNHHDDLFEAEEESLETLLKCEPMDDHQHSQSSEADLIQEEASVEGKTVTSPEDHASISDQKNLGINFSAEGPKLNQMVKKYLDTLVINLFS